MGSKRAHTVAVVKFINVGLTLNKLLRLEKKNEIGSMPEIFVSTVLFIQQKYGSVCHNRVGRPVNIKVGTVYYNQNYIIIYR